MVFPRPTSSSFTPSSSLSLYALLYTLLQTLLCAFFNEPFVITTHNIALAWIILLRLSLFLLSVRTLEQEVFLLTPPTVKQTNLLWFQHQDYFPPSARSLCYCH